MGPKVDYESMLTTLLDELEDLTDDINETNELGHATIKHSEKLPIFKARLSRLDATFQKFTKTVTEIKRCSKLLDKDCTEYDQIRRDVRNKFYEILSLDREQFALDNSLNSSTGETSNSLFKLPPINIPVFNGELTKWPSFKDTYVSLIHENRSLTPVQKFHYLKSSLKGPALQCVASVPITAQDYPQAWLSLTKRYDNKRIQATNLLAKIFTFKPLQHCNLASLEQFSEIVIESVMALKNLKIADESGFILLTFALRLLDPKTRERFETLQSVKEELPSFQDLVDLISQQCVAFQSQALSTPSMSNYSNSNKTYPKGVKQIFYSTGQQISHSCPLCKEKHALYRCPKFLEFNPHKRFNKLKTLNVCSNCLTENHRNIDCRSNKLCRYCDKKHHSLLHWGNSVKPTPPIEEEPKNNSFKTVLEPQVTIDTSRSAVLSTSLDGEVNVLLGTALARIEDSVGNYHQIRIVIDSGAQRSFITASCARKLKLTPSHNHHKLCGFADSPIAGGSQQVDCILVPLNSENPKLRTNAVIIQQISNNMPSQPISEQIRRQLSREDLSDPSFWKPGPIDFLLGADLFLNILSNYNKDSSCPNLLNTVFGGVILGPLPDKYSHSLQKVLLTTDESLNSIIEKFWKIEELEHISLENPDDLKCESHFSTTHSRDVTGRYIVRLPFKDERSIYFNNSRNVALKRFQRLEYEFNNNPPKRKEYSTVLRDYLDNGIISSVIKGGRYFLPHRGVFKDSSSTKLRVVFDASAKTDGGSLNENLHKGPKLQLEIRDVMLNFRLHTYVMAADIKQMFLQIMVHPEDRCYQHFLYRFDPTDSIQTYQLNRLPFGLSCSPYLALRVIKQLVADEGKEFPLASTALSNDIYIDDVLTGSDNLDTALQLQQELINLLGKGGFTLRKWTSNNPLLLTNVPHESCDSAISLSDFDDTSIKLLGMQWNPVQDCISYNVRVLDRINTKRGVMSTIARMYDPLGYLAPVIFKAKSVLQQLWKLRIGWDAPLPPDLLLEWDGFFNEMPLLKLLNIPRCLFSSAKKRITIVGFADASALGYAAVQYLRTEYENGRVEVRLILAKTRLAPIKLLTIPRLELCAAKLLVKLHKSLEKFLLQLEVESTYYFSDSTTVLSWLNIPTYKLKTFVANRVTAILDQSSLSDWYHVQTHHNAADIASRGLSASSFLKEDSWWEGPEWLKDRFENWPIRNNFKNDSTGDCPELKTNTVILSAPQRDHYLLNIIEKFSSYSKLLRVFAYVIRFIHNARPNTSKQQRANPTVPELNLALEKIIQVVQRFYFDVESTNPGPKSSTLVALSPFIDSRGILRVGGRLINAPLKYENKHPILLPHKSHLSVLIVDHYHTTYLHAGPQLLQSLLQRKFWIISGRKLIRSRIHQCLRCHRFRLQNYSPKMADLPPSRFEQGRAFINVGIDFAGPFLIKESKRRKANVEKAYVCLFVCMSTKAVHLEVVSQLSTEMFLAALERFISRRGLPSQIFSDCGTNFVGANRHLKELFRWFNDRQTLDAVEQHLNNRGIQWSFNPPYAPHFGGLWEAGVKSFKYHFSRVVGTYTLTFEELSTLVVKIEAVLNSRPLYPISSSPREYDVLTPGHFLIGAPLLSLPTHDLTDVPENRLTRWQIVQRCIQDVWRRWRYDYLNCLQQRTKWTESKQDLTIGTLVILKEPNVPVQYWPTGRVIDIYPGKDGIIRVVKVKTPKGEYKRAVSVLAPLLPPNRP